MKYLSEFNFKAEKALIRVDFNVPLNAEFGITDDTRLRAALPTIKKIINDGGCVVLMSHLGRPKNGFEDKYSLQHLVPYLKETLNTKVFFGKDCIGEESYKQSDSLQAGEVLLLENLRFYPEEKQGDVTFAKKLAQHGSVYVNDAFGTAHRAHASTSVIAQFFEHRICGHVMQQELEYAQKILKHVERPFTAIMGGAKISDKILIIEKLLERIDHLIIGGGMAYTFFKAQGGNIGSSLVEGDKLELAKKLIEKAKETHTKIHLPIDSIIADNFSNDAQTQEASNMNIPNDWMGLDIGSKAIDTFKQVIKDSKTILWNGPMGVFEMTSFANGTAQIAKAVAEATRSGAFSLIGGGDSAAAVHKFGYVDDVSYVSTGGGALLTYFEGKDLPAVSALK